MANTLLITILLITVVGIHFCLANRSDIEDYEHLRQFFKQLKGHGPSSNSSSESAVSGTKVVVPSAILWCILLFLLLIALMIITLKNVRAVGNGNDIFVISACYDGNKCDRKFEDFCREAGGRPNCKDCVDQIQLVGSFYPCNKEFKELNKIHSPIVDPTAVGETTTAADKTSANLPGIFGGFNKSESGTVTTASISAITTVVVLIIGDKAGKPRKSPFGVSVKGSTAWLDLSLRI
ncbi:hypothetical protein niasHT_035770 [Heterodera trifolii]|uniref:Uncharacterized protein n=1 Tax=Heterodera trifolii TaxID=157864 RepID=A0ABD2IL55_9BILA